MFRVVHLVSVASWWHPAAAWPRRGLPVWRLATPAAEVRVPTAGARVGALAFVALAGASICAKTVHCRRVALVKACSRHVAQSDAVDATEDGNVRDAHGQRCKGSDEAAAALKASKGTGASTWLAVFDFDCTIARLHLWAKYRSAPLGQVSIDDGTFADLEAFRKFVAAARRHGHHVAVATFGRRDVVNKALCYALGEDHGVTISTPADFCAPEGSAALGDKNRQLAALSERFGVPAAQIAFVDDDARNVRAAARAGVVAAHAPKGLTEEVLGIVADWMDVAWH